MLKTLFRKPFKNSTTELRHDQFFNHLRSKEYKRLDIENHTYLDFTGGNLPAQSQLEKHFGLLQKHTFGNPHSTNPTSQFATRLVEEARRKVLDFFNAEDYYCIFTQNATGALKIIGECYPFQEDGYYLLLADNHNSVNGIREYCKKMGGTFQYSPINVDDLNIAPTTLLKNLKAVQAKNKLFAFPAQSNVSGVKHDLGWIAQAKRLNWDVLLDAAAFVPTSSLDLKKYSPDYVSISFYKMFGYPAGLGALLAHKNSFDKLNKRWFAGGTVQLASVNAPYHFLQKNHERFENGTINYLGIPAIKTGLEYIESIGMNRISERIESLTDYLQSELKKMRHSNGMDQLYVFGDPSRSNKGGTIIMCFRNPNGEKISFEKIESLANKKNISLRSGCFCNPGLDEVNNCITSEELTDYFENTESGTYQEMIGYLNKMRGATRISVGIATTQKDVNSFLDFVGSLRDQTIANE